MRAFSQCSAEKMDMRDLCNAARTFIHTDAKHAVWGGELISSVYPAFHVFSCLSWAGMLQQAKQRPAPKHHSPTSLKHWGFPRPDKRCCPLQLIWVFSMSRNSWRNSSKERHPGGFLITSLSQSTWLPLICSSSLYKCLGCLPSL